MTGRIPIEQPNWAVTQSLLKIDGHFLFYGTGLEMQFEFERRDFGENVVALDGGLLFLGMQELGYRLDFSISGEGSFAPHLFSVNPWERVEVEAPIHLYMLGQVRAPDLLRKHVPGSIRYYAQVPTPNGPRPRTIGLEGMPDDPAVRCTAFRPTLLAAPVASSTGGVGIKSKQSWKWDWKEHQLLAKGN